MPVSWRSNLDLRTLVQLYLAQSMYGHFVKAKS